MKESDGGLNRQGIEQTPDKPAWAKPRKREKREKREEKRREESERVMESDYSSIA